MTDHPVLVLHPADNVAVALVDLAPGRTVAAPDGTRVAVLERVAFGHKVALRAIGCGESVIKYGFPIGRATADIAPGAWVHAHNLGTTKANHRRT
jgi:altronate hydrolase